MEMKNGDATKLEAVTSLSVYEFKHWLWYKSWAGHFDKKYRDHVKK